MSAPADSPEKKELKNTTDDTSTGDSTPPLNHAQTNQSSHIDYGHFGPLAHVNTAETTLPAFGGEFQPGLYRSPKHRKAANPAPLGLCAFALTTFMLGCINMNVRSITEPNMIVGVAFSYGGLVQLLAGMW